MWAEGVAGCPKQEGWKPDGVAGGEACGRPQGRSVGSGTSNGQTEEETGDAGYRLAQNGPVMDRAQVFMLDFHIPPGAFISMAWR